jgi:RHS repeat-associated protein
MDGELLAEYAANAPSTSPQKEYGYRSGQLLITATGSSGSSSSQNVTWTNAVGVSISANTITKNVATVWGNSGAVSTQSIGSGDGAVEFTPASLTGIRACGLSNGDSNQNYPDIDFAIYLGAWNMYSVYEGGVAKYSNGPYAAGDRFRVAVESGVVKYYRNGTLFYTSTVSPVYPLIVDTALYTNGYPISNVVISTSASAATVNWLVADQLGTPRMVFDKTGSLTGTKRHDYLPFGEELLAGTGNRTTALGYSGDSIRQKFTSKERDIEIGLDYFNARYYASNQGRFTSPDPPFMDQWELTPQSWNLYSYVRNNPLRLVDPTGNAAEGKCDKICQDSKKRAEEERKKAEEEGIDVEVINMEPPAVIEVILVQSLPHPVFRRDLWLGSLSLVFRSQAAYAPHGGWAEVLDLAVGSENSLKDKERLRLSEP